MINKTEQRKQVLHNLNSLTIAEIENFSKTITKKIVATKEFCSAKTVFCFISFKGEVSTTALIEKALRLGKKVFIPRIAGNEMLWGEFTGFENLEISGYGILEPKAEDCFTETPVADICITPMVAFDEKCFRLGRGKGFYDRFFEKTNAKRVGIAFSVQKVEAVVREYFDKALDIIVTEKEIYEVENENN